MKINIKTIALIMITMTAQANDARIDYSGTLRLGAQYHDSQTSGHDVAIGGSLHAESHFDYGVNVGATLYTTQSLFEKHDAQGVPFFDSQSQPYSILQEVYLKVDLQNTTFLAGRQMLETPFVDSDDIGMVPNAFEAYTLSNQDLKDTTLIYSYVRSMSGVDAEVVERFSKVNGNSGAHALGVLYEGFEDVSLSGWFYALPHFANLSYVDAVYTGVYGRFLYALSAQGAWQDFKEGESAKVIGFASTLGHEKSPFSLLFAYDKAFDAGAINGFGGGPFFANDEHMTLADVGKDGSIAVYGVSWDVREGLALTLTGAQLRDGVGHTGSEVDVVASYEVGKKLKFDAIYSTLDNSKISGDKFDNLRIFANYNF